MATKNKSKSNSADNKRNTNQWQQTIAQEYTYCMVSTLNQMVNYLPMLMFDFQQPKMYLTLKGVPNEAFDKCLFDTCKGLKEKEKGTRFGMPEKLAELDDINDVDGIKEALKQSAQGKKVLWNITGGQRPILLAIFELLEEEKRKDDVVMYLEGNKAQLVWMKVEDQKLVPIPDATHNLGKYKVEHNLQWLTISIALRLMGIKEFADYTPYDGSYGAHQARLALVNKYKQDETLRKKLLALNRKEKHTESGIEYFNKDILDEATKAEAYFSMLTPEELALVIKQKKETYPFGHVLEEMYAAAIYEAAKDNIAEMTVNLKLRPESEAKHKEGNNKQTDEIDIILLTKTGQLVVFEVKSGGMSGDVAKSTKYTTYAIAGVYGKPVLLTALLKAQVSKVGELSKVWPYDTSAKAIRAANRAQLPIIALDGHENNNFKEAIEKLLRP